MKIALIAPIGNLEQTRRGDIHMCLTHLVLESKEYASFYKEETKYKMLDNGAFEGHGQPIHIVVKAAAMVNAQEIVLPDTLHDMEHTLYQTHYSIDWLKRNNLLGKYKLMAAVQGSTKAEWWDCFAKMMGIPELDVIGLSKISCPAAFNDSISGARLEITNFIELEKRHLEGKQFHLLGGSHQILTEIAKQPRWVRSIDTSAPFEYGKHRLSLDKVKSALKSKVKFHQKIKKYNQSFVDRNIELLTRRESR